MGHKIYSFDELKNLFVDYSVKNIIVSEPSGLYEPVNYIMGLPGKRIRPVICLMVANVFSEDIKPALPLAYSIEMFHNFTLVHDDIMDNADVRRSEATVHVKYGANSAILSGDLMMIKSYDHLINCCEDNELKFRILQLFTSTAIKVCEGQQYDMEFETSENVTLSDYIRMIGLKTAVLLAGAFKSGAIIGNASDKDADHFYNYGLNLGLAFQIQDDFLDVYGNPNIFGKKTGGDILQKKKTFLYLKALDLIGDKVKFMALYNSDHLPDPEKIEKVMEIYDQLNIRQYAEREIKILIERAERHLDSISIDKDRLNTIKILQNSLLGRKK